jgi:hypothetical protein
MHGTAANSARRDACVSSLAQDVHQEFTELEGYLEASLATVPSRGRMGTDNSTGSGSQLLTLNSQPSGRVVQALFVFCDLRDLASSISSLKEEALVFLNFIAEIVHQNAVELGVRFRLVP